ncbi:MAG: LytTR family DNA-binding domain-containing protein [Bacteroidota bacterium]
MLPTQSTYGTFAQDCAYAISKKPRIVKLMEQEKQQSIRCVIIDDEEMATKVIESHLGHIPDFTVVGVYHSAVEAYLALETMEIDVLFLDIQMPKITGIELIKMMKRRPLVVLTTAHREYALDGFELEVVDYLLKPIGLNRFLQTISRLKKHLAITIEKSAIDIQESVPSPTPSNTINSPSKHIFIKTNRAYQKIDFDAILYIESIKNHIKIVTPTATHISLIALSDFEKQLPTTFLRVHRSFIVNTTNVLRFDNYLVANEKREIPIGRTYKEAVLEVLKDLIAR